MLRCIIGAFKASHLQLSIQDYCSLYLAQSKMEVSKLLCEQEVFICQTPSLLVSLRSHEPTTFVSAPKSQKCSSWQSVIWLKSTCSGNAKGELRLLHCAITLPPWPLSLCGTDHILTFIVQSYTSLPVNSTPPRAQMNSWSSLCSEINCNCIVGWIQP